MMNSTQIHYILKKLLMLLMVELKVIVDLTVLIEYMFEYFGAKSGRSWYYWQMKFQKCAERKNWDAIVNRFIRQFVFLHHEKDSFLNRLKKKKTFELKQLLYY